MNTVPISVFIPAYNSESFIASTIVKTYDFLVVNFNNFELIVEDDTSADKTVAIVENLLLTRPKLKLIKAEGGPSRRENLAKAMYENATMDYVFFFDADLAVPLENVLIFAQEIHSGRYDVCVASRYKGIRPNRTYYRLFLSKMFNFFLRLFFRSHIHDHICGFKVFKKKSFDILYQYVGYDKTLERGWFWDAEMLIRAQKMSMLVKEIPVEWHAGKESTFNFWREFKLVIYIIRRFGKI